MPLSEPTSTSTGPGLPAVEPIDPRTLTPQTLRLIFDEHHRFVRRNARRLGIPVDHTDDVVQEVFVTLVRRADTLGIYGSTRALLFSITRRVCANYRRRLRRTKLEPLPSRVLRAVDDDGFDRIEAARLVARFLDKLDEPRRAVFVLSELEGMSAPEVAEALGGINVNTVYTRLRAARLRFGKFVARQERTHAR